MKEFSCDFLARDRVESGEGLDRQFDALYIQMINNQLIQDKMKKEEKSTPTSSKPRSVYKYELKATNQIFKDTLDLCKPSLHHTAHTNRHKQLPVQDLDQYLFDTPFIEKYNYTNSKFTHTEQYKKDHTYNDIFQSNFHKKSFQELQPSKKSSEKQIYQKYRHQKFRKQDCFQRQQMLNSQICSFSSQNSNYPSRAEKNSYAFPRQNYFKKDHLHENKKEAKRQRRGLANISLKVKNIVAKLGKMTFKEVSDQVLKQSQEYLPQQSEAREKQMRNIRRRVYDALNVLVSVGILGKSDRCVTHTAITTVPGKKLSEHWEILTQKNRIIQEMQSSYTNKLIDLSKLKKSYQKMLMFHERNRQHNESLQKPEQSTRYHQKDRLNSNPEQTRFYFPIIIVFPPKNQTNNIKVQIQQQQKPSEKIKKFVIDGSNQIQTELALLNYLNLSPQINKESSVNLKQDKQGYKPTRQQQRERMEQAKFNFQQDIYLSD